MRKRRIRMGGRRRSRTCGSSRNRGSSAPFVIMRERSDRGICLRRQEQISRCARDDEHSRRALGWPAPFVRCAPGSVSYTHLRAHETGRNLVCRLLLEKKKKKK